MADVVSNEVALPKARKDLLRRADLPKLAEEMHSPVPMLTSPIVAVRHG